MLDLFALSNAVISADGLYRYRLERQWGNDRACVFVMLNPSTADAAEDDPTIRRCMGFAKRERCGRLIVVNLFAWRATDPGELVRAADPVGPENDWHVAEACRGAGGPVVAAWGAHHMATDRAAKLVDALDLQAVCLGTTRDGAPRHPLYVRADAPLVRYP